MLTPVTWTVSDWPGPSFAGWPPTLVRVSRTRTGAIGPNVPARPYELVASPTQPSTSATRSALAPPTKRLTCPDPLNATSTRFGTVSPATKLRFEAFGLVEPVG